VGAQIRQQQFTLAVGTPHRTVFILHINPPNAGIDDSEGVIDPVRQEDILASEDDGSVYLPRGTIKIVILLNASFKTGKGWTVTDGRRSVGDLSLSIAKAPANAA